MDNKREALGHGLALCTIAIWGTTFVSTKTLLISFSPVEILLLRFTIGFVALSLAHPRRLRVTARKHELYFAAAGLCGVTLYYLLENIALSHTFASNVGTIIAVAPFFTALLSRLLLGDERPKSRFYVGALIAFAGIAVIGYNGQTNFQLNPLGDALAVLGAATWAFYSILTKKIAAFGYPVVPATRRIFFYGLLFMLPAVLSMGFHPSLERLAQPANYGSLLFLGLGASALCFVTWNAAVKILGAVKTSVYIYLGTVITVLASALFLRERITGLAVLGMALTIAGLLLSENRFPHRRSAQRRDASARE